MVGVVQREAREAGDGEAVDLVLAADGSTASGRACPIAGVAALRDLRKAPGFGIDLVRYGHGIHLVVGTVAIMLGPTDERILLGDSEHDALAEHAQHVPDVHRVLEWRPDLGRRVMPQP